MSTLSRSGAVSARAAVTSIAILTPDVQQAIWFLGALIRIRLGGDATAGSLAILEHEGDRGYSSPVHRQLADEETFVVLEGELRVDVGGETRAAGAGAVAFLPRRVPHAFVVTSPQARFLTLHTPAGFDRFTVAAGMPANTTTAAPPDDVPADPAALAALASSYGIEILGPPLYAVITGAVTVEFLGASTEFTAPPNTAL